MRRIQTVGKLVCAGAIYSTHELTRNFIKLWQIGCGRRKMDRETLFHLILAFRQNAKLPIRFWKALNYIGR